MGIFLSMLKTNDILMTSGCIITNRGWRERVGHGRSSEPRIKLNGVLGGRSLDSLMAWAQTRQEGRPLCGYATEQTIKTSPKDP